MMVSEKELKIMFSNTFLKEEPPLYHMIPRRPNNVEYKDDYDGYDEIDVLGSIYRPQLTVHNSITFARWQAVVTKLREVIDL
jgi:hypothetical protein